MGGFYRLRARLTAFVRNGGDLSVARRAASAALLIRVLSAGLAYLSQIFLARWMGPAEFGIYAYVWTWVVLIGTISDFGLGNIAQRFVPRYMASRHFALVHGFLAVSRLIPVLLMTLVAAGAALLIKFHGVQLNVYVVAPLLLGCLVIPLYALTLSQDGVARAFGWTNIALVPPYIVRPSLLLLFMLFGVYSGLQADATIAMLASIAATWLTAIIQICLLDRRIKSVTEAQPKLYTLKPWLTAALPVLTVNGLFYLFNTIDILVLQEFRPPEDIAVYFAATKAIAIVSMVYFSVSATTARKFAEYEAHGDRGALADFFAASTRWMFWASLVTSIALLIGGIPLLWLYGATFVGGYPLLFVMVIGVMARASIGPVEPLLVMLGQQNACAVAYAAALLTNFFLCLMLIPKFGTMGAAASTSISILIETVLLCLITRKRLGIRTLVEPWPPKKTSAAFMVQGETDVDR